MHHRLKVQGNALRTHHIIQIPIGFFTIRRIEILLKEALAWFPRANHSYVMTYIQQRFWRPAWEKVVYDLAFVELFEVATPKLKLLPYV